MKEIEDFPFPSVERVEEAFKDDLNKLPKIALDYFFALKAIREINQKRRELIKRASLEEREFYYSKGRQAHKRFHTLYGVIDLIYPECRTPIHPTETLAILEKFEDEWIEAMERRHVEGESMHDLSNGCEKEGRPYSTTSIRNHIDELKKNSSKPMKTGISKGSPC